MPSAVDQVFVSLTDRTVRIMRPDGTEEGGPIVGDYFVVMGLQVRVLAPLPVTVKKPE